MKKHIGVFGNSPFSPTICNKQTLHIISILDTNYSILQSDKICSLCKDLILHGTTRGLAKSHKLRSLEFRINRFLKIAQRTYKGGQYCDYAHKLEEDLIETWQTKASDLLT